MVGPNRPLFVLFGSSIVQLSYYFHGWGATLATLYSRKADIMLRGYAGWNSRMALKIYERVFPKDAEIQPSLVILYFGGNDSADPEFPNSSHVPLDEYVENMRKIALHIKGLSENTRLIMLSAPPVNEEQVVKHYWDGMHLTKEGSDILVNKILDVIKEAKWEPSLDWNKMPDEFADIGSDLHFEMLKESINKTVGGY
ncbi:GDSL esterase/lipase WDL1-like [Lycium barbarum]|uniref:GDSL esterase/lipase WDL1-like n=1 Tax=Lycium barbarum TaxID=112863 RepID=UPI00293E9318|nr:GDSL esterase/lipase WDL1-like [Lycium barbarum]